MKPRECGTCLKPLPARTCPACGRPQAEAGLKLRAYLLRLFPDDPTAQAVIRDGFTALMSPQGGGCTNEIEALLAAFREAVGQYGVPEDAPS